MREPGHCPPVASAAPRGPGRSAWSRHQLYALPQMQRSLFLRLRMEGLEPIQVPLPVLRLYFENEEHDEDVDPCSIDRDRHWWVCSRDGGSRNLAEAAQRHIFCSSVSGHFVV